MRYIEIDARNVLWENQKEFINELCNRVNNDFVKNYLKSDCFHAEGYKGVNYPLNDNFLVVK